MTTFTTINNEYEWQENLNSVVWDNILSAANGHPLQSASWGDARHTSDGIKDFRWAVIKNGQPIYLVRFEERYFFKIIKIAWIPQGPTIIDFSNAKLIRDDFLKRLKDKGFFICVENQWKKSEKKTSHYTIWLNLTVGKDTLWKNLHKQFRYDVKRSFRENVTVEKRPDNVDEFYQLCKSVSDHKEFYLNASVERMNYLLKNANNKVESHLFVSRYKGKLCAGAFIIRCGDTLHYIWGAADRSFSKFGVGAAVQWGVLEWGIDQNCKTYDMGGVIPSENDGIYQFKKKLGGNLISLEDEQIHPLNIIAKLISIVLRKKNIVQFFKIKNILRLMKK